MKPSWLIDRKKPLDRNIRLVIPAMYDRFIAHSGRVINHPRLVDELHRMRIDGKPLRYLMELCHDQYGEEFRACLKDIKEMIELMGEVRDCDVFIPVIRQHLEEVRYFNRRMNTRSERISLRDLRQLVRTIRDRRSSLFQEMAGRLLSWQQGGFKARLLNTLTPAVRPAAHETLVSG